MSHAGFFRFTWILALALAACGPAVVSPPASQASPAPAQDWTVKLTQSGGFAGVLLTVQVSSDGTLIARNERAGSSVTKSLPPEATAQIASFAAGLAAATSATPRSGCADCFLYRLEVTSGGRSAAIDADDTTLAGSGAAELIQLLQRLRDEALRA